MKRILLSALAILVAMGLIGSSFAYFSDTESSEGNTFTAGTWDLSWTAAPDGSLPFQGLAVVNIAPGWSKVEEDTIYNLGSLSGEVWITAENFAEPTGDYTEPYEPTHSEEMTADEFAMVLRMRIEVELEEGVWDYETVIYDGPLYGMVSDHFPIAAYDEVHIRFTAYLPEDVDNRYQADGVVCDIVFYGTTEITLAR